jgi:excisionase family DNA binding protein
VLERSTVNVLRAMHTHTTPTPHLTIAEAARFCGVSTKTLRRAVRARRLAYFKPARGYLFTVRDLEAYMDAHRFGVVVFGPAV